METGSYYINHSRTKHLASYMQNNQQSNSAANVSMHPIYSYRPLITIKTFIHIYTILIKYSNNLGCVTR